MKKYIEIISSPTFQLVAVALILQALQIFKVVTGEQANQLTDAFQQFLIGVAGVRAAARIGSAKPNTTSVSIPTSITDVAVSTKKSVKKKK